ncbi:hypothetical protein HOLleu_16028 [Holothuria leucospilota]|uniref:Pacifastin domain-containing protein n=1 Tax=Holothuria leucospilota TaxID=206669 RepID=A0A9Q1C3I1_HOLLE|nr:hypothetical protein HOLleu_16028 [Holothuria leucospilota]
MKLILTLGIIFLCFHICSPKIIPIPGKIVGLYPKPKHGACFQNNAIMCSQAGMKVQYDGENCVDCTCNGGNMGITCCNVEPFPNVCHPKYCNVWLNTNTCQYDTEQVDRASVPPGRVRAWHQACRIESYEIGDLPGESDTWEPDNDKFISSVDKIDSKSKSSSKS